MVGGRGMRRWYDEEDVVEAGSVDEVEGNPEALALYGPESLVGIERLGNLERLVLYSCDTPEGLECLAGLPKLSKLVWRDDVEEAQVFGGKRGIDVGALAELGSLRWLGLYHHRVTNGEALGELTQLEGLEFKGPLLGGPIGGLERLTELRRLRGNIGDLGGMAVVGSLVKLERLDVFGLTAGDDCMELAALGGLEELTIGADCEARIELPALPRLRELEIDGGVFRAGALDGLEKLHLRPWVGRDYGALAGLEKLRDLRLPQTRAEELTGLGELTALERLDLVLPEGTSEVSELESLAGLRVLRLFGAAEVESLEFIEGMPVLEELTVGGIWKLESLETLPAHDGLKSLVLSEARSLASLGGVERLVGLEKLRVMGMDRAVDVAPLTLLAGLREVALLLWEEACEFPFCMMEPERTYRETAVFDGLVDCPSLEWVELDSEHRAAEIEAALALGRGDGKFVRRRANEWGRLLFSAPEPERTIPLVLGPMLELLGRDGAGGWLDEVVLEGRRREVVVGLLRGLLEV